MTTAFVAGRFDGLTAVVTGAGSGIGKATAERLLAEGATVVASDISTERLDAFAAEAATERLLTVAGDVSAPETAQAILDAAGGRVDALVNNAGVMDGFLPTAEITDEVWERVLNVNLTGPMRLTRAVLPSMVERGSGTIVNVASEAGIRAGASGTSYAVSKSGVIALTKSTAFFYGSKGIRTNAVAPGGVNTNIEAPFLSQLAGERLGPLFQAYGIAPAEPTELAAAITWLLSADSSNVNGTVMMSDGGWSTV